MQQEIRELCFLGDFNVNTSDSSMKEFCSLNGLKNLINKLTWYKNSEKPTCIDLILTNQPTLFQHNTVLGTGLSDFHLLTVTEFKISFQKCRPHIITYRNYKNYDNDAFKSEIQSFCSLSETDLGLLRVNLLHRHKHAPIRKKYLCANAAPFITKELHNTVTKRSRYRNKFLTDKSQTNRENYKIQRNFCKKLLKKTNKSNVDSLNAKRSRRVEPSGELLFLFSRKRSQKVKRLFLMKRKNISDDKKICKMFNYSFQNVVPDLKIPNHCNYSSQKNILSQLPLKRLKNTPVFLMLKKNLDSVFSLRMTT